MRKVLTTAKILQEVSALSFLLCFPMVFWECKYILHLGITWIATAVISYILFIVADRLSLDNSTSQGS
jgi:hypothetical protein